MAEVGDTPRIDREIKFLDPEKDGSREKPFFLAGTGRDIVYESFIRARSNDALYCFKFHGTVFKIGPNGGLAILDNQVRDDKTDELLSDVKDYLIEELVKRFFKKK